MTADERAAGPAEADLRQAVLDAWARLAAEHESSGRRPPSDADKRMLARATVRREIDAWVTAAQQRGEAVLSGEDGATPDRTGGGVGVLGDPRHRGVPGT